MEITTMPQAMQLHAQILKSPAAAGPDLNLSKLFTFSALSPRGDLRYARLILDSLAAPNSYFFNTMIRAYSQSPDPGHPPRALSLFLSMLHHPARPAPGPDKFTYPFVFKCCARSRSTRMGKQVHGLAVKSGLASDRYIEHALIHMYYACGRSGWACKVFDRMSQRDVVSWTCMIDGMVDDDCPVEAIRLFERMREEGVGVNDATVVSVLRACADTGALGMGKKVHEIAKEIEIDSKANVSTGLIDMYTKCGDLNSARQVFDDIAEKDAFACTAMIAGLASHGKCMDAIDLFREMRKMGIKPDERMMTAVLSACRNEGLGNEGLRYFKNMRRKYGVRPTIHHYGCIVDILARAGQLDEAEEFIRKMPIEADAVMWRNLIWACNVHGDMERGERLMKNLQLLESNADDCGSYVLIGNVYASAGKWHDKAKVRELMDKKGLRKPPGSSRIEIDGLIHEFVAGDSSHPEAEKIYEKLDEIEEKLLEEKHSPKLSQVLLEIDDEVKAFQLRHHSEKLAVAFGLIKTNPGSEIRIVKNLRSCEDCHAVMKLLSKIYQREIIMRDRIRFHYFRHGECSCGDCW
ncbi:pentatricopeptide repeat-containing protein At1g08070, chloroplastic-like [Eucalyptus grandis]|uniref:pentatricopeptide repeat-containing protein At1g08070, chloroplastic-like n=1 Tax=Eucalyptus grandis TaxID=71139 RepID=UPI0005242010|nr:pentatricopeptide repeat-containing protein At1g08070, chloroplastic-like [Eucalyptus grandis]